MPTEATASLIFDKTNQMIGWRYLNPAFRRGDKWKVCDKGNKSQALTGCLRRTNEEWRRWKRWKNSQKVHFPSKNFCNNDFFKYFYCFLSQKDFSVQLTLPIKQLLSTGNDKECLKANNWKQQDRKLSCKRNNQALMRMSKMPENILLETLN